MTPPSWAAYRALPPPGGERPGRPAVLRGGATVTTVSAVPLDDLAPSSPTTAAPPASVAAAKPPARSCCGAPESGAPDRPSPPAAPPGRRRTRCGRPQQQAPKPPRQLIDPNPILVGVEVRVPPRVAARGKGGRQGPRNRLQGNLTQGRWSGPHRTAGRTPPGSPIGLTVPGLRRPPAAHQIAPRRSQGREETPGPPRADPPGAPHDRSAAAPLVPRTVHPACPVTPHSTAADTAASEPARPSSPSRPWLAPALNGERTHPRMGSRSTNSPRAYRSPPHRPSAAPPGTPPPPGRPGPP